MRRLVRSSFIEKEKSFCFVEVCYIVSFAIIMLNTSLHNKSARMGGGPFTYEKFVNSLSETISRHQVPDQNLIKVKKI
jgi:Sec7-like guanine-nucleotide exchange factor